MSACNLDYKLREECAPSCRAFSKPPAQSLSMPHGAFRSAIAWRPHRLHVEGEILQAGETRKSIAIPTAARRPGIFRSPLNIVGSKRPRLGQYAGGVKAPASDFMPVLGDGAYRVGFRAHQLEVASESPAAILSGDRHGDRKSPVRKVSCISIAVLPTGSPCCMACTNIRPGTCWMRCSIPAMSLCSTRRPSGRRARRDVREMQHGRIDLVDLAHSTAAMPPIPNPFALKRSR